MTPSRESEAVTVPRKPGRRKAPERLDKARKLQRALYRVAKSQPQRRLTLLYDKVCQREILEEAWRRVKSNGGAAGVDLHERCRLYRMVGKVSHLEGLRRTPPNEDSRRAGCGKTACPVR
jgi:hypothetical protein